MRDGRANVRNDPSENESLTRAITLNLGRRGAGARDDDYRPITTTTLVLLGYIRLYFKCCRVARSGTAEPEEVEASGLETDLAPLMPLHFPGCIIVPRPFSLLRSPLSSGLPLESRIFLVLKFREEN